MRSVDSNRREAKPAGRLSSSTLLGELRRIHGSLVFAVPLRHPFTTLWPDFAKATVHMETPRSPRANGLRNLCINNEEGHRGPDHRDQCERVFATVDEPTTYRIR